MAIIFKASSMFQLTTAPTNPNFAVAHTGGWSESWWSLTDPYAVSFGIFSGLVAKRAALLPIQGSIIGYRVQKYDMVSNQLRPMGSQIYAQNFPGRAGIITDMPQVAVQIIVSNLLSPNKANMVLRAIPDDYVVGGEYQPDTVYSGLMTTFRNALTASGFGFVGRDRAQASTRVLSASQGDGILVDGIPGTGIVAGDWIRLNRVFGSSGVAIVGPFKVTSVAVNTITVIGWPAGVVVAKPTGTLRRDLVVFVPYTQTNLKRATVKKVGSPFEKYRGRRSRKRV